jgi:hypothetical protein
VRVKGETKMEGNYISPVHRRYRLEPGNGTCYNFSITWLAVPREDLVKVVSGVSTGGYVTITIHDYLNPGTYEFAMDAIREAKEHTLRYAFGKFPKAHKHDVVAVLLAASILVGGPMRVEEAMMEMLIADEILSRMEE